MQVLVVAVQCTPAEIQGKEGQVHRPPSVFFETPPRPSLANPRVLDTLCGPPLMQHRDVRDVRWL